MYAVDPQTGRELWRFEAKGPVFSPAVAAGVLYFSGSDGNMYAMSE